MTGRPTVNAAVTIMRVRRLRSSRSLALINGQVGSQEPRSAMAKLCWVTGPPPRRLVTDRNQSSSLVCVLAAPVSSPIGPWRMTLPWSTMATASQVRSTSSSRCEDSMTVRPSSTRPRSISRISRMPAGSRPFIGSSSMSSCGSASRQAARPSRWRMPME